MTYTHLYTFMHLCIMENLQRMMILMPSSLGSWLRISICPSLVGTVEAPGACECAIQLQYVAAVMPEAIENDLFTVDVNLKDGDFYI